MKKLYFILLLFLISLGAKAGIDTLASDVRLFAVDDIGQLYYSTQSGTIYKHQLTNDSVKNYNNILLGEPDILSAKSGARIYAYYAGLANLEALDNYLRPIEKINLIDRGYSTVECMAASADGGLWLFDAMRNELVKLSQEFTEKYNSDDLRNVWGDSFFPRSISESGEEVFLISESEVLVFDRFANLKKSLPIAGVKKVIRTKKGYIFLQEQSVKWLDEVRFGESLLDLQIPYEQISDIGISLDKLFLLADGYILCIPMVEINLR